MKLSEKLTVILSLLLFSVLWCLCLLFVLEKSYETIDPCSSTPSFEFTNVIFIVPFVFILLYFLLNLVTKKILSGEKKHFFIIFTLSIVPLISAYLAYSFLDVSFLKETINKNEVVTYFYTEDCYHDITVSGIGLGILSSLFHFAISSLMFLIFSRNR